MDKQFKCRMPEDLHNDLKVFCVKNNISMQEFAIQTFIKEIRDSKDTLGRAV